MRITNIITVTILSLLLASEAMASSIVYTGINPEITPTANPNNETAISNLASLTKKQNTPTTSSSTESESQLLKDSVISGLSSNYQQILTQNCTSCGGTVNFGDGSTAVYSTVGSTRYITFYDLNGQSTQISFPLN